MSISVYISARSVDLKGVTVMAIVQARDTSRDTKNKFRPRRATRRGPARIHATLDSGSTVPEVKVIRRRDNILSSMTGITV